MNKIGMFWFKYRSYSPLPLLLVAVFFPVYNPLAYRFNILAGAILIITGEIGRIWCVGYAGGITRTRTGDLEKLVTSGPFAYVRNPIYISNIIMYLGVCVLLGVTQLLPYAFLYFFIQYSFIIAYEESILLDKFGDEYSEYKKKIRRWIPSLYIKIIDSEHIFKMGEALHSERRTFTAIIAVFVIAFVKHLIWVLM